MTLVPGQHIYLVGIGGSGLSAIARVLLGQGYTVSGSDRNLNNLTEALARDGATIYQGHDPAHIQGADALIVTSAVGPDHVEVAAAREAGIPVYKRQDIIADLMRDKKVIAVAGTKGKTTTTSMIVHILRECGADPSYIVGGVMGNTGTNAGVGKGKWFVIEADEYENMFLGLRPDIAVITNIEWDHPDFFKTPEEMFRSFQSFANRVPKGGSLVVSADDPVAALLAKQQEQARNEIVHTYSVCSTSPDAYYRAYNPKADETGGMTFELAWFLKETHAPRRFVHIPVPGAHNVQNAMAALIASYLAERATSDAVAALESFIPPARRFELRADVDGIAIIDDYAHNPMSIRAVLEAARQRYPDRAIWAVWQPHTYSRTQALMDDFARSFDQAHHVLITDIYAAREQPLPGVISTAVIARMHHPDARHTPMFADAVEVLRQNVTSPAVILIMSAGDAPQIGIEYLKTLVRSAS